MTPRLLSVVAATCVLAGIVIMGSSMSAFAATGATVAITITPSTGLTNGAAVTITGSGFANSSPGNVLQCNSDASQPTVMVGGVINHAIAVGCNAPSLSAVVSTSASGALSTTFHVIQGTVGPPCGPAPAAATCPATDSAGQSPTADAALYPCPPTAAQQAAGDTCTLTYGDLANDTGMANITFAASSPPPTTPTTVAPTTATTKAPTPVTTVAPATGAAGGSTAPATGALATTGPGRGVGFLAAIGAALLLFGLLLFLVLLNVPQRAFAGIFERGGAPKVRGRDGRDRDGSLLRHGVNAAQSWVGHLDRVGQRVGNGFSGAPGVARGVTARVVSASTRTAAWLLGR